MNDDAKAWMPSKATGLRAVDVEAAAGLGLACAALSWLTAGFDGGVITGAAVAAFFMSIAALMVRRGGAVLLMSAITGIASVPSPSIAGPGIYKLWLLLGAGLLFEVIWLIRRKWSGAVAAATLAAMSIPIMLLILSGEAGVMGSAINLSLLSAAAGLIAALLAVAAWDSVAHSKWAIRFEVIGRSRAWHAHRRRRLFNAARREMV
jgi:hypothetical protein